MPAKPLSGSREKLRSKSKFHLRHYGSGLKLPRAATHAIFMPVSPPPYMNGGPREYLSWVIECKDNDFLPKTCAGWLEGRLHGLRARWDSGTLLTTFNKSRRGPTFGEKSASYIPHSWIPSRSSR